MEPLHSAIQRGSVHGATWDGSGSSAAPSLDVPVLLAPASDAALADGGGPQHLYDLLQQGRLVDYHRAADAATGPPPIAIGADRSAVLLCLAPSAGGHYRPEPVAILIRMARNALSAPRGPGDDTTAALESALAAGREQLQRVYAECIAPQQGGAALQGGSGALEYCEMNIDVFWKRRRLSRAFPMVLYRVPALLLRIVSMDQAAADLAVLYALKKRRDGAPDAGAARAALGGKDR